MDWLLERRRALQVRPGKRPRGVILRILWLPSNRDSCQPPGQGPGPSICERRTPTVHWDPATIIVLNVLTTGADSISATEASSGMERKTGSWWYGSNGNDPYQCRSNIFRPHSTGSYDHFTHDNGSIVGSRCAEIGVNSKCGKVIPSSTLLLAAYCFCGLVSSSHSILRAL